VTFLGRLENRKGVVDLARAIPSVLQRHSQARFRFVGASDESPEPGVEMLNYLKKLLSGCQQAVEFSGPVRPEKIPEVLADADICVFPSLWENFPYVCLEAMTAARAIIGSSAGGMSEMLAEDAGRLVPPHRPAAIARAISKLLEDTSLRTRLARMARTRVLEAYGVDRIGKVQEASYGQAILRRQAAGPRRQQLSMNLTMENAR
jgi:glycosyltransferase involved in cell wall biosynthesis